VDAVRRLWRSRSRCYGQVTISNACDPVTALRWGGGRDNSSPPIGCRGPTPPSPVTTDAALTIQNRRILLVPGRLSVRNPADRASCVERCCRLDAVCRERSHNRLRASRMSSQHRPHPEGLTLLLLEPRAARWLPICSRNPFWRVHTRVVPPCIRGCKMRRLLGVVSADSRLDCPRWPRGTRPPGLQQVRHTSQSTKR
jgi:hypothetical protein